MSEALIGCAEDRCLHARNLVGAYAILVDAKDEKRNRSTSDLNSTPHTKPRRAAK